MGMSLQDFDQCTPLEFEKIFEMWHESQETAFRNSWEQIRQLAVRILMPYTDKELEPHDVMEFTWDKDADKKPESRKKSRKERETDRRHYEEVKKERGLS